MNDIAQLYLSLGFILGASTMSLVMLVLLLRHLKLFIAIRQCFSFSRLLTVFQFSLLISIDAESIILTATLKKEYSSASKTANT